MKIHLLFPALLLCTLLNAQITEQWINEYDNFADNDVLRAMTIDDSGNVYVTGSSWDGSVSEENYVTIKYNTSGVQQWRKEYDNFSGADIAYAIAVDTAGNVYVTGASHDGSVNQLNYVTIKYNPVGTQLWVKEYDNFGGDDAAYALAVDSMGNVYVTGASWDGSIDEADYVTIKYNAAGTQQWLAEYDNFGGPDTARAIAVDRSGNVIVTGSSYDGSVDQMDYTTIKYNAAGVQQWLAEYDNFADNDNAYAMVLDTAGNVYVTGASWDGAVNEEDYVTIKYSAAGVQQWIAAYDNFSGADIAHDIAIDRAGCVYITGQSYGGSVLDFDYVTVKYSGSGAPLWEKHYDNFADNDIAYALVLDTAANVYVTGASYDGSVLEEDFVTIKYDSSGVQQWLIDYDNSFGPDKAVAIAVDRFGSVYVAGPSDDGAVHDLDYVTIKYCIQPVAAVATDTFFICYGDNVQISGSGGNTCSWSPAAGLSNSTVYSPMASPTATTSYVFTALSVAGCPDKDTVVVVVRPTYATTEQAWICAGDTFMFPDSTLQDTAGTHISMFTTSAGCDSLIYTFLHVDTLMPDTSVTLNGVLMTSNESGAQYQWINCNNGQPIPGATGQSYFPPANGNYAVIVYGPGCHDTSACINITSVHVADAAANSAVAVYPNPTNGVFTIDLGTTTAADIFITDAAGRLVFDARINGIHVTAFNPELTTGIYLLTIQTADEISVVQLLVD